ncbi:MAG: ribonuclease H-like domain-containing protein [Proteobacteria bacterium]|nr:ribonuclease H-like domain-containing protein [Pseudomonadota bacterium]
MIEDDWLWGWDPTPGIVSVWASSEGHVTIWRRVDGELVVEHAPFRPWILLARAITHPAIAVRELAGPGHLRYLVRAADNRTLQEAVRHAHGGANLRELGEDVLVLPPEEQYLVATGRTYFKELAFDQLRRLQLDLETTGLDPTTDRIFLVALRAPDGATETIEGDERDLIAALVARVTTLDPDVIENHNLHGFDLPFLATRARLHGVPLTLGRVVGSGPAALRERPSRKGRTRFTAPGRELIDTLDAVLRYDFATRELPGHGLKVVARHLGIAAATREHVPGGEIFATYARDPARVRRYAIADVEEAAALARMLGGAAFALATMAPRRYERLADAGAATGVIDPMLVRAYLRSGAALPAHEASDGTPHVGAALHLFAAGVARDIAKADVASLYPSLMCAYQIGPARDHLGALLAIVARLVDQRLAAKAAAKAAPAGSTTRHTHEAMSAAMKLIVNSAYGYLAAGGIARFTDVHAANDVTRRGRELLDLLCRELAARGGTLLEADTDGVYFCGLPDEAAERRVVAEVAALLPARIKLEFEGRYAAMLSHEPKNYALVPYGDGPVILRGVAFRSSRAEPFGERFLRRAIACVVDGDARGVREVYLATIDALRRRELRTLDVASRVRLSKDVATYLATRATRREHVYEAMLAHAGAASPPWKLGARVRVYRTPGGGARIAPASDPRDYDVDHYVRVLRDGFASRLITAFRAEDFAAVFADPDQLTLFAPPLDGIRPILTILADLRTGAGGPGEVVRELPRRRHDGPRPAAVGEPVGDEPAIEPVDEIDADDGDEVA